MAHTSVTTLSPERALFELTLINAETSDTDFDEVVLDGLRQGIPPALLTRLKSLWNQTRVIAGEVVAVGKVIIAKIIAFILDNPKMAVGMALGAAVASLVGGVPLLGPILAPVSSLLATLYGAGVGTAMQSGDYSGSPMSAAIHLADKFFELLHLVFNAVASHFSS